MIDVQKNDAQWKAQAVQLFQTEKEIADEREFLGLEDISADDLYAGLIEEHESEVVREVTAIANAAEQAERIRTAAEALVAALTQESDDYDGLVYYEYAKELADLQMALSRGWLSRSKAPQDNCRHLHTKRLVLSANKRNQFDEPFAYHCTDCNRTFGEKREKPPDVSRLKFGLLTARMAVENLMDAIENSKRTINHRTQVTDVYFEMESSLTELKAALEGK